MPVQLSSNVQIASLRRHRPIEPTSPRTCHPEMHSSTKNTPPVDEVRDALYREAHIQFLALQRRPAWAVLLSCLISGAGQIYNGEYIRGLWMIIIYLAGAAGTVRYGYPVFIWIPFWIWGMEDARRGARRGNRILLDRLEAKIATQNLSADTRRNSTQDMKRSM